MAKEKKISDGEKKKLTKRLLKGQCCENCFEYIFSNKGEYFSSFNKRDKHCYCIRKQKLPTLKICSHWSSDIFKNII